MQNIMCSLKNRAWLQGLKWLVVLSLGVLLTAGTHTQEAQTAARFSAWKDAGLPARKASLATVQGKMAFIASQLSPSAIPMAGSILADPIVTAGNGIYQVHVLNNPGSGVGLYTATTGPDHPAGPGLNVLFGNALPRTTFNTIRSYTTNTDYIQDNTLKQSANNIISLDPYGTVTTIGTTGFRTTYVLPGPPTTPDALTIVTDVNVNGTTFEDSSIEVTTTVVNNGDNPVQIGIRYLWDYQIGLDDGPTFQAVNPDSDVRISEIAFPAPDFESYRIQDNDVNPNPPTFFVFGTTTGPDMLAPPPTPPDLLQYVSWPLAFGTAFDYEPSTTGEPVSDSAVNYFFGPDQGSAITIPAQGEHTVSASVFAAPVIACTLTPASASGTVGEDHSVTVTVISDGTPVADQPVEFSIVSGPNSGISAMETTDTAGQAHFTYRGDGGPGEDVIEARGALGLVPFSCTATQTWTGTATPTPTDVPAAPPTPTPTPASGPPRGRDNLTVQVFIDHFCDGVYHERRDIPLGNVPITLTFPDGSARAGVTTRFGMVNFTSLDTSNGLSVSADLPDHYRGYGLRSCANSPTTVELEPEDFEMFGYSYAYFGMEIAGEDAGP